MPRSRIESRSQSTSTQSANKIHNPCGYISQRYGSAATAAETTNFVLDRWKIDTANQDELAFQISRSDDVPVGQGFPSSHLINVNTAEAAVADNEYSRYYTNIEARDLVDVEWSTASAKKLSISFWVKSSVTGTYGVLLWCQDPNQSQTFTYTINAANTWEKKEIIIPPTGHTGVNNDNGIGMRINFFLMAGTNYLSATSVGSWTTYSGSHFGGGHAANSFVQTAGNKWYMTGLQIEVADVPGPFQPRTFDEELMVCQRYYQKSYKYSERPNGATNYANGSGSFLGTYDGSVYRSSTYNSTYNQRYYHTFMFHRRMKEGANVTTINPYLSGTGVIMQAGGGGSYNGTVGLITEDSFRVYSTNVGSNSYGNQNGGDLYVIHWTAESELG